MRYKVFLLFLTFFSCHEEENINRQTEASQFRTQGIESEKFEVKKIQEYDTSEPVAKQKVIETTKDRIIPVSRSRGKPEKSHQIFAEMRETSPVKLNDYEVKKEQWSTLYSHDSTWQNLYSISEKSFLKGWENEFRNNPPSSTKVNKALLITIFSRRLEKVFFNFPSFIQYSIDKFSNSQALQNLQTDWKIEN
ncbi:MAG: hypothetical protein FJZ66_06030 [Bacteroidetes bacterium]|nr:hypothetical protein [Bacteroidota bacterium]MBM3456372.1 hypothetical protein [Bacteroidota bacterium]